MPEPIVELDDEGNPKVVPPVKDPQEEKPKVTKLELTQEELDAKIAAAVAKKEEEAAVEAKRKKDEEAGNFKQLLDAAEDRERKANLALWRTKALKKFNLSDEMFDALNGETEEEIMASAKKLNGLIEEQVKQRADVIKDGNPPPDGRKRKESKPNDKSGADVTRDNLSVAFGKARIGSRLH